MKKKLLMGGILMLTFLFSGCHKKIDIKDTKCFHFSYSVGNYMNGSYSYKIDLEDDKYIARYKANQVAEEDQLVKEIDKETVLELENILVESELYKWNNFRKYDKHVLDGHSFSLYYRMMDDTTIEANGYEKYPSNYSEFKERIHSFFERIFEKEIEKQKTTQLDE